MMDIFSWYTPVKTTRMAVSQSYNVLWSTGILFVILPHFSLGLLSDYKICGDSECEGKSSWYTLLVNSHIRNSIFKAVFRILSLSSIVSFVFLFKWLLCGCVTLPLCVFVGLVSRVKAIRDYQGKDCRFLSLRKGDTIFVYHKLTGKREDLWAGSVRLISYTSLSFSLSLAFLQEITHSTKSLKF